MKRKIKNLINAMCYELRATRNKGMTYVELIVVLSIFSIMSVIAMFNYREFQAKIDIKSLATDIALQVVQAQKDSIGGKMPPIIMGGFTNKPSYGVHFDINDPKILAPFVDLDNNEVKNIGNEGLDTINITKNNRISALKIVGSTNCPSAPTSLDVVFRRPDSSTIISANDVPFSHCDFSAVVISISSPAPDNLATANMCIYPSGRIEIKDDCQ